MKGKNSLPERKSCHRRSSCHQSIGPLGKKNGLGFGLGVNSSESGLQCLTKSTIIACIFLSNLVEQKHEESPQATSDRVHHDIGDHIDGGGDGGQGEGHLS